MKTTLITAAAIAAIVGISAPAAAQRLPAASIAVVDLGRVSSECNACKTAIAALRAQGAALNTRAQQLSTSLRSEEQALQTSVNALAGKQPDAALTARVRAFQTKQESSSNDLQRQQQQIQRNQAHIQQQINVKLVPVLDQVLQRRGANVMIDAGSALRVGPGLDVTNDVLTGLNAVLTTVSTTAPAQAQQPAPTGR